MALSVLPFSLEKRNGGYSPSLFPKPLRRACAKNGFLAEYLKYVPLDEIGVPDYYPRHSRGLSDLEDRNLIYPIEGGLFVHIYPDETGARDR